MKSETFEAGEAWRWLRDRVGDSCAAEFVGRLLSNPEQYDLPEKWLRILATIDDETCPEDTTGTVISLDRQRRRRERPREHDCDG